MKTCPQHGQFLDQYKFCPFCAWQLDNDARRTDFELGLLEALNTIKQQISTWLTHRFNIIASIVTICAFIVTILGIFGFNELINNRVEKSVNSSIEKLDKSVREMVDNSVEKSVREEVGRIHNDLRYLLDIFPIIEIDFFRIRSVKSTIKVINNEKIKSMMTAEGRIISDATLSSKLISDSNSFDFISNGTGTKDPELISDSDFLFHNYPFSYLISEQIDIFKKFNYLEIKISMNVFEDASQYPDSVISKFSEKLDTYVNSIDKINISIDVNKVNFYQDTIKRNDLKKSGKLEYTSTINLRDTFNDTELLRKRYIKSIDREKRKSQLSQ